ncbi:transcriptional regulator [Actinoplanes cyaneus]|uniref:Transcriptional regulator n=1 Tax=Actinoplanes cyaneus TaxID=52696 RepID=A0A919M8X7_9ACTN|nr:LuxR family transcriptional regulator [Actinoplanes cyaneus]MCW2143432.1 AAA ATPase domain-containing protein [Actinoplanes cyaneus]GID70282.1 transcriptional regulator [Actinoplanes cyaneus]
MNPLTSSSAGDQLTGRDVELARISRLLDAPAGNRPALVITGDRGSGRSSLLGAGIQLARRSGRHRVLTLAGSAGPAQRPYPHLLLALRHDLAALPASVGGPARAFLGLEPDTRAPHDSALPSVVAAAITAVAAGSPVLIVVDDADHLDPEVLAMVVRLSAVPSVAVLAASRTPPPAALAGMPVLELPPLSHDDAVRVLAGRGRTATAAARAAIRHRARGNPAALVELGDPGSLAGGLLSAFGAELSRLPDRTRMLLCYLAAAGVPADPELIGLAARVPGADGWRPATAAGLVTRTGNKVVFSHPLADEAAYRSASIDLRLRAHQDLAAALTASPEYQALQSAAAEPGADERIAAALEAAAAIFRSRGDLYEATAAMQKSAERSPAPDRAARRLARAVADARDLRDTAWATEMYAQVRALTGDAGPLVEAAWPAAAATLWSGRPHEAYAILTGAGLSNTVDLAVLAATTAWLTGDEEHRLGLIPFLATAPSDATVTAYVRQIVAPEQNPGHALCDEAVLPPDGVPLSARERYRLSLLGMIAWTGDRTRLAVEVLRRALAGDLFEHSPSPGFGMQLALVNALLDIGEWELAQRYATTPRAGGMPTVEAGLASLRALLHALRGENEQALRLARETWRQLDVPSNRPAHVRLLRACGLASIGDGDHDDGYRYLRSMFDRDGRPLHPYLSARAVADLAAAAARSGRHDDARTVLDQVRLAAGTAPGDRMRILLELSGALLGVDEDGFRRAAGDAAGAQWPHEHGLAHLHHGVWLRRHGSTRDARAALTTAADIFTRLGATGSAELAQREISVGGPSGPGAPTTALTAQERQVAELAAGGLSNRLIAERLFISARTVGTHLSRVYRKIGVTGRHELRTDLVRA